MITRRVFIRTLAGGLAAVPLAASAQQAAKVPRIGYLVENSAASPHLLEAFRQGLLDLGYVEGRARFMCPVPVAPAGFAGIGNGTDGREARGMGCACGHDDINLEANQFGRKSGEPLELPLGISVFDHHVAALDVTEVTQSLEEGRLLLSASGQVGR